MLDALLARLWKPLTLIALVASLLWGMQHYRGKYISEVARADAAQSLAAGRQSTIDDMTVRQRDVAALDAKYTKELADANAENAALQRKLDNGGRVHVSGKCPVPAKTGTASVDDGETVELSDIAGRNVLGIRAGIKQDQAALRGLQDYIKQQCMR